MATNTKYLADALLNHIVKDIPFTEPSGLYLALFTSLPDSSGIGGVEVVGTGYQRKEIRSLLSVTSNGTLSNTSVIEMTAINPDWGTVVGIGIYDTSLGGSLLRFMSLRSGIENFSVLRWDVGKLSFSYTLSPEMVSDWELRPKINVFDGYQIIYAPTGTKYVYSENVKDYVRYQYWKMFQFDMQAELSGNYLPLDEPDYPWGDITGDTAAWSIFNDGTYDWLRLNSLPYPSGSTSGYRINKALPTNFKGSYFSQGHIHVPTKSAQTSSNTAALNIFGARPDGNRASYTFSAGTGTHQNRISHVSTAVPSGPSLYLSPLTTTPVWYEIYFMQNREDNTKFKSLIYLNHALEPNHYYDETYASVIAPSPSAQVSYGDLGADNLDMRTRDFKFGNLWYIAND